MEETAPLGLDERVDLEGDNDIEEMSDEDIDEPTEEEATEEIGISASNSYTNRQIGSDSHQKTAVESRVRDSDRFLEAEEKVNGSVAADDRERRAQLLALPPHGSEIFIGGLPRDASEEDLRDLCGSSNDIFEIRPMKDKDHGGSRGFAFITFRTKERAQQAIEDIHNKEFKGRTLRCSLSQSKHRLFMGNIPKCWMVEELREVVDMNGPGVEQLDLVKDPQNSSRNRGFAFIEYYNHACADYARQNMSSPRLKLDGNTPTVTWADPKGDPSATAQVKALYVKNIPDNTTSDQLKEIFQVHGEVTKVVLPPNKSVQNKGAFGFVHFADRSSALKAINVPDKYEFSGHVLDVSLAKPQADKKLDSSTSLHKGVVLPSHIPYSGYGFIGDPYGGAGGAGYNPGVGQPMIYGRGPLPSGMQMVPMVLPDGRLAYVLQNVGAQAAVSSSRRSDQSGRNSRDIDSDRSQRKTGGEGSHGRRYHPY